jgi:Skp family chaperone for outer membrane proteins
MPETLAPQVAPAERDLQRAALRALVELCERCAAREQEIEQQHVVALEAANKELDRTNWGIEERFKNQQDAIREKYEGRISTAEERYKKDFDALKHSDSLARQRLDHEKNAIDRDVKKSFEQAAWLAESVFDAAQIGVEEEFKKVNDDLTALSTQYQTKVDEYNKLKNSTVPAGDLQQKADAITDLETKIKRDQEDAKKRYDQRMGQVVDPINADIVKAMTDYAKQKGFAVILDGAKLEQAGVLLGFDDKYDITKDFITFYNGRTGAAGTTATTAPPVSKTP